MKKYFVRLSVLVICAAFFSFSAKKGGDTIEIYLNGKQVHQQFVHNDKSTKNLHLSSFNGNDKIDVFYSHCGVTGKNRVLTLRNEKNELIKELKFADAEKKRSFMSFYQKDVAKSKFNKINLYYSSKELPEGKLLATLTWDTKKMTARL